VSVALAAGRVSRRGFMRATALSGAAAFAGVSLGGCSPAQFAHGVASGDPGPTSLVLWTRATPDSGADAERLVVGWELALDAEFDELVAAGVATTGPEVDFTVKIEISDLTPGTRYFYRFRAAADTSDVGRARTLPTGQMAEFAVAVISCVHFAQGRFHVLRELAGRDDVDLVLHLGDAIYESRSSARWLRPVEPPHELYTLADYRARHAFYRGDADLRAAHAAHAFAMIWDDHEVANNAHRTGAAGHDPGAGDYAARRAAAVQAYYEWQPVREPHDGDRTRLYRSFEVGSLLAIHMLDTRHIGRDAPLDYADYASAGGVLDGTRLLGDLASPARSLLGDAQRAWLDAELAASSARHHVLAQQVVMAAMWLPAPIVTQRIGLTAYFALVQRARSRPSSLTAAERALLAEPAVPYNPDAWDGYLAERDALLSRAAELGLNLVVLSGDSHNAWASDLRAPDGTAVGAEFATPSVSSRGLEERLADSPDAVAQGALSAIPTLRFAQTSLRGYLVARFRDAEVEATYHFVDGVLEQTYSAPVELVTTLRMAAGERRIAQSHPVAGAAIRPA
jgi:alkaline phosphatase D